MPGKLTSRKAIAALLGLLLLASAWVQMHYRTRLGWLDDDWEFLLYRTGGGLSHIFEPHNEHISVIPVLVYKLFFALFGLGSTVPIQFFSMLMYLFAAVMLFVWMRKLVGEPASLIGCAVILFFGIGYEDLLWAFQIGYTIAIGTGLAALVMLRRDTRRDDLLASLLLCVSILTSSMGLAFAAGGAVALLIRKPGMSIGLAAVARRLAVVAPPVAIFAVWWLIWGSDAESSLSLRNLVDSPEYVFNAYRTAASGLTGTFRIGGDLGTWVTAVTAVAVAAAVVVRVKRAGRVPAEMLVALAAALTFWGLAALNFNELRPYDQSRYQVPGAIFVLMVLAGAFEGVRPGREQLLALAALATAAIAVNISALGPGYRDPMLVHYEAEMAAATATEIGRPAIAADFPVFINGYYATRAEDYYEVVDRFGDAGWSVEEALARSNTARTAIDGQLVRSLPVVVRPTVAGLPRQGCRVASTSPGSGPLELDGTRYLLRPTRDVSVMLGRFGDGAGVPAGEVDAGQMASLSLPRDLTDLPWKVGFAGGGMVRVCPAPGTEQPWP